MVCEKCNEIVNEGLKFCTKCGYKIKISGKGLLEATGILLVLFGLIGIVLIYVPSIPVLINIGDIDLGYRKLNEIASYIISTIGGIIATILSIITGILGIKYCGNVKKAKLLIYFALIVILLNIAYLIFSIFISSRYSIEFFESIILILPICFLIGAYKNLKFKGGK